MSFFWKKSDFHVPKVKGEPPIGMYHGLRMKRRPLISRNVCRVQLLCKFNRSQCLYDSAGKNCSEIVCGRFSVNCHSENRIPGSILGLSLFADPTHHTPLCLYCERRIYRKEIPISSVNFPKTKSGLKLMNVKGHVSDCDTESQKQTEGQGQEGQSR